MSSSAVVSRARAAEAAPVLTRALAVFAALHGLAHFAGTSDAFTRAAHGESVDFLAGAWTVSDPVLLRAFGVLWAVLGAAFILTATVVWMRRPGWPRVLGATSLASLILVAVAVWAAWIGVIVDVALIAAAVRWGALRPR